MVLTLLYLYFTRNFGQLVGLECPEPLANLYTRSYFRATWVTTALDAGFWTAMHIKPKWLKDFSSVIFTVYYLFCAEQADEKVRKVRGALTLEHLRISWNKPVTPYIEFFGRMLRPKLMRHKYPPREIRIPRPSRSSYTEPVSAWLYFDGPLSALKKHDKVILDIPGGGFVAMDPRCHEDKLLAWAGRTGLPLLALDYKKAPEHPYPYALNECYDVYHSLVATRGQCIGLSGDSMPKIVVSGDSAGGNLAVGLVLMILQSGTTDARRFQGEDTLPPPEGCILIYPALDMNIGNWMTDEQMALIRDRRMRKTNQPILRQKSDDYYRLAPETPHASDNEDEDDETASPPRMAEKPTEPATSAAHTIDAAAITKSKATTLKTRLAMSSMITYFNDRILTPEMMRAMIILYIGPHSRPDFSTDYLLSPLLAPESLLARFPKTYLMTGERDPLVDDTVIFAGRLRAAKQAVFRERKELGLLSSREVFDDSAHVSVLLVPGISHGFLQFVSVYPHGWRYIFRCARWMSDIFRAADVRTSILEAETAPTTPEDLTFDRRRPAFATEDEDEVAVDDNEDGEPGHQHERARTLSSASEDAPLEMTMSSRSSPPLKPPRRPKPKLDIRKAKMSRAPAVRNTPAALREEETRNKSLDSLASTEDLLGRRMKGFTGGLMGSSG